MLSEKELMIGDWVMYDPNVFIEDEYVPAKECYPTKIETGEDIDSAVEGCYYPIPITPEILEKNGFKKDAFTNLSPDYYYDDNVCSICINLNSTCDKGKSIWVENRNSKVSVSIEESRHSSQKKPLLIHQLQHALRLCGIKKEIEVL